MDPTEIYAAFEELADEFPNLAELITLPNKTNGYQRRAQATMAGGDGPGDAPDDALQAGAVVLTSRAWGHEGGNDITAEFLNPGAPNAPLSGHGPTKTSRCGWRPTPPGATSTGAQVVDAIKECGRGGELVASVFTD